MIFMLQKPKVSHLLPLRYYYLTCIRNSQQNSVEICIWFNPEPLISLGESKRNPVKQAFCKYLVIVEDVDNLMLKDLNLIF